MYAMHTYIGISGIAILIYIGSMHTYMYIVMIDHIWYVCVYVSMHTQIGASLDGSVPGQCGDNYFRYPVTYLIP